MLFLLYACLVVWVCYFNVWFTGLFYFWLCCLLACFVFGSLVSCCLLVGLLLFGLLLCFVFRVCLRDLMRCSCVYLCYLFCVLFLCVVGLRLRFVYCVVTCFVVYCGYVYGCLCSFIVFGVLFVSLLVCFGCSLVFVLFVVVLRCFCVWCFVYTLFIVRFCGFGSFGKSGRVGG